MICWLMREGLQWKALSHEARVAGTWNGKPGPPSGGARHKNLTGEGALSGQVSIQYYNKN